MKMGSLKKNSIFLIISIMFSCNKSDRNFSHVSRQETIDFLKKKFPVELVRHQIYDSLEVWKKNKLEDHIYFNSNSQKVDTIIAFNSDKSKIVTVLHNSIIGENPHDGSGYLFGAKIKNKWYFFEGAYMVMPRKNKLARQTFSELSEFAYKNIFRNYLKTNWKGELEINEKFFVSMENSNGPSEGYGPCFKCQNFEEYVLFLVEDNWSRVDSINF